MSLFAGHNTTALQKLLILLLLTIVFSNSALAQDKLTMNMRDADIRALIQWVSDNTGKNIIVHRAVQGNVTVLSPQPLSPDEAYQVFLSVLQTYGFAAIETADAVKIVPQSLAANGALPYAGSSVDADMVVSILKIKNISVTRLSEMLRPLMSKEAVLTPYAPTNALVIADHANNIDAAKRLIKKLDVAGDTEIEIVALKNADAAGILISLNALMPNSQGAAADSFFSISADERSNSILLFGDPAQRSQFKALIQQLDSPLNGQGNTQVVYLHYVDAKELVPILKSMAQSIQTGQKDSSNISIESSESANALVINAPPAMLTTMKRVISQLDIRRAQVLIEAMLVEVSGDVSDDLGVTWMSNPDNDVIAAVNTLGDQVLAVPNLTGSDAKFSPARGMTFGYFNNGDLLAAVRALESTQKANILSTPTVVAIDNMEASLLVGQNVPFKTGQSTSASSPTTDPFTTIERQDIGISLVVTPRINEGDSITLEINQKTENIAPSVAVASDIVTNKREIITKALIKDGQVLVLGGLISNEESEIQEKVPFLGDLPLIGKLFSSTGKTHTKKNFMVFIHPTILKNDQQIQEVSQRRYNFMQGLQQQVKDKTWAASNKNGATLEDFETFSPVNR